MNVTQWQARGYKTIIRHGYMYLYRPNAFTYRAPIDNGKWMRSDNLNEAPWKQVDPLPDFSDTAIACYCEQVRLCDFCSGLRHPQP